MALIDAIRHRAAICGYVVDAVSGLGIGDAVVVIGDAGPTARTGPDGFYGFLNLAAGTYDLTATAPGLGSRYGGVAVVGVQVASDGDGSPILDPNARLALPPTRLTGTVRRADTSAPIPRATVRLRASEVAVPTAATGAYRISAIEAGTQTAVVSATGFVAYTARVVLTAGAETPVDFNLIPS